MRVREFLGRKDVEREQARSEALLLNVLPAGVATELKANGRVAAKFIESCTILFTDFVGFTRLAGSIPPEQLVASLDRVFSRFDAVVASYGIEKLKTIGDAYMCAAGVTGAQPDHLLRMVAAGLEMYAILDEEHAADGKPWDMRLGIHPGPVVAGVIGQHRFAFDLWGDTVNTASRLTDVGEPQRLSLETPIYRLVEPFFEGTDRGMVEVRGKGALPLTSITRLRPEYAADASGRVPNERFLQAARSWTPAA
jgi:class 3 adenylate cyclase